MIPSPSSRLSRPVTGGALGVSRPSKWHQGFQGSQGSQGCPIWGRSGGHLLRNSRLFPPARKTPEMEKISFPAMASAPVPYDARTIHSKSSGTYELEKSLQTGGPVAGCPGGPNLEARKAEISFFLSRNEKECNPMPPSALRQIWAISAKISSFQPMSAGWGRPATGSMFPVMARPASQPAIHCLLAPREGLWLAL